MDLSFLMAKCSVRKLPAMLISNSSWITAASAFIFLGKSLQGILMTPRKTLSLKHTVITHCQERWKRTNRKFPCGKACFISSPFSCHSSGRSYYWNKLWEQMKAVTLSTPCPYIFCQILALQLWCFPRLWPRAQGSGLPSPEMRCGLAGQRVWTPKPSRASQHGGHICFSAATASCLRCVLASSSWSMIFFVLPLGAFQNLAGDGSQILMTAMEVKMLLPSLPVQSGTTKCVSRRVKLKMMCDICC